MWRSPAHGRPATERWGGERASPGPLPSHGHLPESSVTPSQNRTQANRPDPAVTKAGEREDSRTLFNFVHAVSSRERHSSTKPDCVQTKRQFNLLSDVLMARFAARSIWQHLARADKPLLRVMNYSNFPIFGNINHAWTHTVLVTNAASIPKCAGLVDGTIVTW